MDFGRCLSRYGIGHDPNAKYQLRLSLFVVIICAHLYGDGPASVTMPKHTASTPSMLSILSTSSKSDEWPVKKRRR